MNWDIKTETKGKKLIVYAGPHPERSAQLCKAAQDLSRRIMEQESLFVFENMEKDALILLKKQIAKELRRRKHLGL